MNPIRVSQPILSILSLLFHQSYYGSTRLPTLSSFRSKNRPDVWLDIGGARLHCIESKKKKKRRSNYKDESRRYIM
jgi:hypothetical protein